MLSIRRQPSRDEGPLDLVPQSPQSRPESRLDGLYHKLDIDYITPHLLFLLPGVTTGTLAAIIVTLVSSTCDLERNLRLESTADVVNEYCRIEYCRMACHSHVAWYCFQGDLSPEPQQRISPVCYILVTRFAFVNYRLQDM